MRNKKYEVRNKSIIKCGSTHEYTCNYLGLEGKKSIFNNVFFFLYKSDNSAWILNRQRRIEKTIPYPDN